MRLEENLNDKRLSWQAKGLYAYLVFFSQEQKIVISELSKKSKGCNETVHKLIEELEKSGYVKKQYRDTVSGRIKGTFDYVLNPFSEATK